MPWLFSLCQATVSAVQHREESIPFLTPQNKVYYYCSNNRRSGDTLFIHTGELCPDFNVNSLRISAFLKFKPFQHYKQFLTNSNGVSSCVPGRTQGGGT